MADPLTLSLTIHLGVLPFSLFGLYRYTDRTDLFAKSVADSDALLSRMRSVVANNLEIELTPVFERSGGEPTLVLPDDYFERPTNPVGSEVFRQALRAFIDDNANILMHYRKASDARTSWCKWARHLSWTVLLLAIWEVICVALFGLVGQLFGVELHESFGKWSFVPTVILVIGFFLCQGILLHRHDVIHDYKDLYNDL